MTELLVLEALEGGKIKWDDKITCSAHAASMGGSDIWIEQGEVMSVSDLFKAMAVNSANDAAVALGETVAGSEPAFANLMNEKAKTLGMNDTHFVNCTGLDADNNYTSAYDVMLMSKALIQHRDIFNYSTIWMDTLRGGKTALYNTNRLIRFYNGANGLKTGSTSKAGYCLSATALRENMQLIAVVMDCDKVDDRFSSASNLLDYGFANWSYVSPKIKNGSVNIQVLHGDKDYVQGVADGSPSILTDKGKENAITQKVSFVPNVLAPVIKGQVVGQITFWVDGKNVGTVPIKANASVSRMTFFKAFGRLFGSMVGS
jgi:D-alanyl-D-alanine carboxypeptidase (penicillin-binding protein 5/6)